MDYTEMCFGQLNYIKITNNTKMEGKLKKRYSRILQELELNHGEIIKDSVMVKDGKKIVNIRTYSSSSDSPGFSLTQNDVNNRATVAIVLMTMISRNVILLIRVKSCILLAKKCLN